MPSADPDREPSEVSNQGAPFKVALLIFLGLGLIGLGLLIWLSTIDRALLPQQQKLSDAADWAMKTGFGATVGMLVDRRLR